MIFVCFVPLLIFRDFTPNNELKYLSIVDEAIRNHTVFTFYNHGTPYADKPPLYFWCIRFAKWLAGDHYMFLIGLFSLIPALSILYIMDKWTATYLPLPLRSSSQLMLITTGLFTGSAIVLRMDMLMCLFIVLSLYTFYKMYIGEKSPYDTIRLPAFIFLAILTKGPVGILVPFLSITLFLWYKKQIRTFGKYLGWKQWATLLFFFSLWLTGVYIEGGKEYLHNLIFHQTVHRAVNSFHHQEPFWYYMKTIWYALAPWILFYVVLLFSGLKRRLLDNDLKRFFFIIIASTFISLSLFSSKLDIYLLPIYPFVTYLCFLFLPEVKGKSIRFSLFIPAFLLLFSFPAYFIVRRFIDIPFSGNMILTTTLILSISSLICLLYLRKQRLLTAVDSLATGILLSLFAGGLLITGSAPYIGWTQLSREAKAIATEREIQHFYFYRFRSGENLDALLKQEIEPITLEEMKGLSGKQNFITFVKNKDLRNEEQLQHLITQKQIYTVGNYSFIVF